MVAFDPEDPSLDVVLSDFDELDPSDEDDELEGAFRAP